MTDKQIEREIDRWTDRWVDRWRNRWIDRQIDMQGDKKINITMIRNMELYAQGTTVNYLKK